MLILRIALPVRENAFQISELLNLHWLASLRIYECHMHCSGFKVFQSNLQLKKKMISKTSNTYITAVKNEIEDIILVSNLTFFIFKPNGISFFMCSRLIKAAALLCSLSTESAPIFINLSKFKMWKKSEGYLSLQQRFLL